MIDNGSTDNPMSILNDYIKRGVVSYYYRPKQASQIENYQNIFKKHIWTQTYWLAVVDCDEFLYGVDHKLSTKLRFLRWTCG